MVKYTLFKNIIHVNYKNTQYIGIISADILDYF